VDFHADARKRRAARSIDQIWIERISQPVADEIDREQVTAIIVPAGIQSHGNDSRTVSD